MSDVRDDERPDEATELDEWEEEEPRSGVFQALWFRLLLVLVVVGGAAAVSAPYLFTSSASVSEATGPRPAPGPVTSPAAVPARPAETAPAPAAPTAAPPPVAAAPAPPVERATPPADRTRVVGESSAAAAERTRPAESRKAPAPQTATKPAAKVEANGRSSSVATAANAPVHPRAQASAPRTRAAGPEGTVGSQEGDHWVQVGAFRDAATARQLAERLRQQRFRVEEFIAPAPPARDTADAARYTVVVPTAAPDETLARLRDLGVTAEAGAEGAVVTPPRPLREAVALAKTITGQGLRVQVRRAPGSGPAVSTAAGADTLHRVRVGAFPNRASALVAARALEDRGFQPFVTREVR